MSQFRIARSFEGLCSLQTDDLLTAIKTASNYEADLYLNGVLIFSPLGYEMEYNKKLLQRYGISVGVVNGSYHYKYMDESLNTTSVFASFYPYLWDGKKHLDVHVFDYKKGNATEFKNFEECIQFIQLCYTGEYEERINIISFLNNECVTAKIGELNRDLSVLNRVG
ncbi:hypothetical protein [Bacillus sp. SM2101]|uniref:hypothetical protein n=1 Tax=Bacillus sp. SM2101 TaxID=2805366 RepID=UPI001BDE9A2A|nr:hypothetical protein [Bacillus sp. SM2101]